MYRIDRVSLYSPSPRAGRGGARGSRFPATPGLAARILLALLLPLALLPAPAALSAPAVSDASAAPAGAARIQPPLERFLSRLALPPADSSQVEPLSVRASRAHIDPGEIAVLADGKVLCWVTTEEWVDSGDWEAAIAGCEVDGVLGSAVQVRLPPEEVASLARLPGVTHIGLPPRPVRLLESEGLEGMRVHEFRATYGSGAGARIGVIDLGFMGYQNLLGTDLPARVHVRSYFQNSRGEGDITGFGERHGTACAEIVYDVAPGAELYLANVATAIDLQNAVEWMIQEGVEVISHSVGWFSGNSDGTGPIQDIVARARERGVLWVNAAGNFSRSHWTGMYRDDDGDGNVEVDATGREHIGLPRVAAGQQFYAVLIWDAWPNTRGAEFELDLLPPHGTTILATSESRWAGVKDAYRPLAFQSGETLEGLRLRIRSTAGDPTGIRLRVIRADDVIAEADQVREGSLVAPADSPDVIAVGAYAWDQTVVEPFSSLGPSLGGLLKPELLAPDRVASRTYSGGFTGTSAACPHVAGAVGLLLSASVQGGFFTARWSREDVLRMLERDSELLDQGEAWGRVRLPLRNESGTFGPRLIASGYGGGALRLRLLDSPLGAGELHVFDVSGRMLGSIPAARVEAGVVEYRPEEIRGMLRARGRYWALEPQSGARTSFYWPGGAR